MPDLFSNVYNPDVLSCLANLSNDEVFTPPSVANQILDLLPQELFENPNTTFLDPCCKSGVFLREIAKRLIVGLEEKIPDLQERLDNIFHKQLFGIAITELTSLLSRRSVYCSKYASSKYSVSHFDNIDGNVKFKRIEHTWNGNKCIYCGASKKMQDIGEGKETHAYEFIHKLNLKDLKYMKFDVIIGNPPYQLNDGGGVGSSALPIYNKFVEQAKKLNPRYLTMIIPSRWFTGGRGLDNFRDTMLHDNRLQILHDFPDATDCFPGVEIKGGVCYFLWNRNYNDNCTIVTHSNNQTNKDFRPLLENELQFFIRNNDMVKILHKIREKKEITFDSLVSANDPFGFDIRVQNSYKRIKPQFELTPTKDKKIKFYYNGWRKDGIGYVSEAIIRKGKSLIKQRKIFIPKAWGTGNTEKDWLNPIFPDYNSCCTETYLVLGPFKSDKELQNVYSYTQTKFFHAIVSVIKITQNTMQKAYSIVPIQDFSIHWTDQKLYKKYGLTEEEISFIESMIKPMNLSGDNNE